MKNLGLCVLLLGIVALSYSQNTLQGLIDVNKLQGILQEGVKSKDIGTLFYSLKGLKLLNAKIPEICQEIKSFKYDTNNVEQIYYLTNAAALSGCVSSLNPEVMSAATKILDGKDPSIPELYQAVFSLKALGKGQTMEKDEALKTLIKLLKKDDSPINYGYVFALCEHLGCQSWSATHAEGVLQAADESDGSLLHFEGGLPATALLLSTIIRSFAAVKKPTPLTEEQRYKFSEYLLTRRSVNTPRGAALLLEAALALADDQPTPISIAIKGRKYVTAESDSIQVTVSDLVGRPVRGLKPEDVIAQSGTRLADDVVVLSKQQLTQKTGEPTTFVLNLSKIKSQYGVYKIALSAGAKSTSVTVAALGQVRVGPLDVGVVDNDGGSQRHLTTVSYPDKLADRLQADHLQNVVIKFSVRDNAGKAMSVQQAFVRVAPADGSDEAIFVAEPDYAKVYKVELNVGQLWKHVSSGSGVYSLSVFVGDSAISNPVAWRFADASLNFGKHRTAVGEAVKSPSAPAPRRGPLPQIAHRFRVAEPRPPRLVSDAFAAACAAPLLLLLLLWGSLRINLSNFPFSLSALIFHLSLGASLSLYGMLWLQLSMFETVRYLMPLGLATFLSGHRLLRRLVHQKH